MSDSPIEPLATKPRWESLRGKSLDGDPPRFTLRAMAIAITMACVHLTLVKLFAEDSHPGSQAAPSALALLVWQSTLIGLAYTGAFLILMRVIRRADYRIDPGHWILGAIGFAAAAQTAAEFLNYLAPQRDILAAMRIHTAMLGVCLTLPLLTRMTPPIWKIAIATILALTWGRLWIAMDWSGWSLVLPLFTLATLLVAASFDRDRTERGWFHWAGVSVWILTRCVPPLLIWLFL